MKKKITEEEKNNAWWDYSLRNPKDDVFTDSEKTPSISSKEKLRSKGNWNVSKKNDIKDDTDLTYENYYPSYGDYIKPKELTNLQVPLSSNPEERVFIMIHQMFELAFKQMIFDFDVVAQTLNEMNKLEVNNTSKLFCEVPKNFEKYNQKEVEERDKDPSIEFWEKAYFSSNRLINSTKYILSALTTYLDINNFSGLNFAEFRPLLLPASGFQSEQFRTIQKILGKNSVYKLKIFGSHEFFKKYTQDEVAWEKMALTDEEKAKEYFVSIIDKLNYNKNSKSEMDWDNPNMKFALNLCDEVNDILSKIGTSKETNSETDYYKDSFNKNTEEVATTILNKYLEWADPFKFKGEEPKTHKDIKEYLRIEVSENLKRSVKNHTDTYLNNKARNGMRKLTTQNQNSFLFHILKNLSLTDELFHSIDNTKRNRDRSVRNSILDRPYFSFLERHIDFIDNHISIVMSLASKDDNVIGGSGGGGKNYLEFAMRLYELYPAFPAVNERILK